MWYSYIEISLQITFCLDFFPLSNGILWVLRKLNFTGPRSWNTTFDGVEVRMRGENETSRPPSTPQAKEGGLQEDLAADSVPAPGAPTRRWLFYRGGVHSEDKATGVLRCNLCLPCRAALGNKESATGKPAVRMPECARARGFWGGPEPAVLRQLSFAERKVLRLARVYSTVKRISAHILPYGRLHPEALPEYSTRNVVAYAQDPDAVMRVLCVPPEQLAQDLYVQFEGAKDTAFRNEPALRVNIEHLRDAIYWYVTHNWQWLELTKDQEMLGRDSLGAHFEELLEEYGKQLDDGRSGVPRILRTWSTEVDAPRVPLHHEGPADAGGQDHGEGSESSEDGAVVDTRQSRGRRRAADSSAAVLDTSAQDRPSGNPSPP